MVLVLQSHSCSRRVFETIKADDIGSMASSCRVSPSLFVEDRSRIVAYRDNNQRATFVTWGTVKECHIDKPHYFSESSTRKSRSITLSLLSADCHRLTGFTAGVLGLHNEKFFMPTWMGGFSFRSQIVDDKKRDGNADNGPSTPQKPNASES